MLRISQGSGEGAWLARQHFGVVILGVVVLFLDFASSLGAGGRSFGVHEFELHRPADIVVRICERHQRQRWVMWTSSWFWASWVTPTFLPSSSLMCVSYMYMSHFTVCMMVQETFSRPSRWSVLEIMAPCCTYSLIFHAVLRITSEFVLHRLTSNFGFLNCWISVLCFWVAFVGCVQETLPPSACSHPPCECCLSLLLNLLETKCRMKIAYSNSTASSCFWWLNINVYFSIPAVPPSSTLWKGSRWGTIPGFLTCALFSIACYGWSTDSLSWSSKSW